MSTFQQQLHAIQRDTPAGERRWCYVAYDQLNAQIGPLSEQPAAETGIVLVESSAKAARRPYHKRKLALVLANMRHFALEQARRGVRVEYRFSTEDYERSLAAVCAEHGPLDSMEPAERELRQDLLPLVEDGRLRILPHAGWLTSPAQFQASQEGPPWRMDAFYRHVRRATGFLMADGEPEGGRFSFDVENRRSWAGDPPAPQPPSFAVDTITREVVDLVESRFREHPGRVEAGSLPVTAEHARLTWEWAKRECLHDFGPYQDAMSCRSASLFHTRISGLLHLHRLLPRVVVEEAAAMELPIESREGFVRQVLGWREFVRHVHRATDGMRTLPTGFLGSAGALPPAFWPGAGESGGAGPTGLNCLDTVLHQVWETGYGHHITRLMVLSNIATLLDVDPRALTDWFWVAYEDAYDWVVEPNVLGMGTFAVGDAMTTKPYVSGAAYIDRMGDFCAGCAFDPPGGCPITALYWAFLARHADALAGIGRMRLPLASCRKRSADSRARDERVYGLTRETLLAGRTLRPADLGAAGR